MAALDFIKNLTSSVTSIGKENGQFRQAAAQQNNSISKFIRDISKMFTSQSKQQSEISGSLNSLEQSAASTASKIDQTNVILQESISIQTNMLAELRNLSSGINRLLDVAEGGGGGGGGSSFANIVSKTALGAGLVATGAGLESQFGTFSGLFGGGAKPGTQEAAGEIKTAQLVQLAKEAGFTDEQAVIMGAIGSAESSGNPMAHNTKGRDNSYGLWQVNMLDELGVERRKKYGLSSNEELFDPKINIQIAKDIFDEAGGSFQPWGAYTDGRYQEYLGTAMQSAQEKDDASAPAGTYQSSSDVMGENKAAAVYENQEALAGIRKGPLSPRLKGVLDQAAAAAGVEAVVYSGGQPAKGSGGARTGSTRHDNGNAADLYLMKDGKKLVDTNPADREIMAKFVSAAVAAGATGVGAGHGYMGPSNIHVGFGKQATWGGAPWIQAAASGVYDNADLTSQGGYSDGATSSGGITGIPGIDGMLSSANESLAGTPFAGIGSSVLSAIGTMAGGFPLLTDLISLGPIGAGAKHGQAFAENITKTGTTNLFDNIFQPPGGMDFTGGEKGPYGSNWDDKRRDNDEEFFSYDNDEHPEGDDATMLSKDSSASAQVLQDVAMLRDSVNYSTSRQSADQKPQMPSDQSAPRNYDRQGSPSLSSYSSSPSWYQQLAGRIHNDSSMHLKGGVLA